VLLIATWCTVGMYPEHGGAIIYDTKTHLYEEKLHSYGIIVKIRGSFSSPGLPLSAAYDTLHVHMYIVGHERMLIFNIRTFFNFQF